MVRLTDSLDMTFLLCPVAQLVACLTADPGVTSLITAKSHTCTFMEIDHEKISKAILLLPLIQEGLLSVTRKKY